MLGERVGVRVEYSTRPPTVHHLGEEVYVERLGDLGENGPEIGLERGAVLPVEGHPDSRPALVQPGHARSRDGIKHVRTLARWPDDNSATRRPGSPPITPSDSARLVGGRALDLTKGLPGAVGEDAQIVLGGDQINFAAERELDLAMVEYMIVDGGAVVDLDPGRDLDPCPRSSSVPSERICHDPPGPGPRPGHPSRSQVAVRHSHHPDCLVLVVGRPTWSTFIDSVKNDELNPGG